MGKTWKNVIYKVISPNLRVLGAKPPTRLGNYLINSWGRDPQRLEFTYWPSEYQPRFCMIIKNLA